MGTGRKNRWLSAALAAGALTTTTLVATGGPSAAQQSGDDTPPPAPTGFEVTVEDTPNGQTVTVSWLAVDDASGIAGYEVFQNGDSLGGVPGDTPVGQRISYSTPVRFLPAPAGDYWFQVRAADNAGNNSVKTAPIRVFVDIKPPSIPRNAEIVEASGTTVSVEFDAPNDDSAIVAYAVSINAVRVSEIPAENMIVNGDRRRTPPISLSNGRQFIQFVAIDAFGNRSGQTIPVEIFIGDDTTPPFAPLDPLVVGGELVWVAPFDDVAVTGYVIVETRALSDRVTRTRTTVSGSPYPLEEIEAPRWLQVLAFDAAGNESKLSFPVFVPGSGTS